MENNLQTIAEGLSEAQRRVVVHPDNTNDVWPNDRRVENALIRKGIIAPPQFRELCDWTPLGLALRTYLLDQEAKQ